MRSDEKKSAVIFILCGIVPVVWAALLTAPYIKNGLPEILEGWNQAFRRPFGISFCEESLRTVLFFFSCLFRGNWSLVFQLPEIPERSGTWIGSLGERKRDRKTVQRETVYSQ